LASPKGPIEKDVLEDLYLKQRLLFKEIAEKMCRSGTNVCRYLRVYKIPKRGRARRIPKTDLEELYVNQKLSLRKICELYSRSVEAIRHDLAFYGIACRTWHGGRKGPPVPRLSKEVLVDLYLKKRKSAPEIGEETGRTKRVILLNLAECGISRRVCLEARKVAVEKGRFKVLSRENHPFWRSKSPFWRGGTSFEPYPSDFNEHLKNKILRRDGYVCQECGITQGESLKKIHRKLTVHHIDYDKKNCDELNLITLCLRCNINANSNRNYWKKQFSQKLSSIQVN
jgi:hypothetical protein